MSFKSRFLSFWSSFANFIFANHGCLSCRREIPDGSEFSLCDDCMKNIDVIDGNICKTCGEKILNDKNYCDNCKAVKFNFDSSMSFSYYLDVSANIIKRFKYSGKKYYAEFIAKLMTKNKDYFSGVDYLTFVPIGIKRRKERGFNQAEEIASYLGKFMNIPVVDTLQKCGTERHQAGLSQKERQENLSGSIALRKDINVDLKNKTIMIIDDVFTTGSTLSECAKILKSVKSNKPSKILCYTFAKTVFNSTNNGQNQQNNYKSQ